MTTYDYIGQFDFDQLDAAQDEADADDGVSVWRVECGVRLAAGGDDVCTYYCAASSAPQAVAKFHDDASTNALILGCNEVPFAEVRR